MQALLKVGLVLGIFFSINVFYLLHTDSKELEVIPILKDVVAFVRTLKDGLIAEEKDDSHASKQSDHHSRESKSSVNKDSANERQVHTKPKQSTEKNQRKEQKAKDTTDKHATRM